MEYENASVQGQSEFRDLQGIEYFDFEEDFIEQNVRCIPMIVRFKMDSAGIKLSLEAWSKFSVEERKQLSLMKCTTEPERITYKNHLEELVLKYTGKEATPLNIEANPAWADTSIVPGYLLDKAMELDCMITLERWGGLSNLQRFALLKLYKPGHENKNFRKALKEFGLLS